MKDVEKIWLKDISETDRNICAIGIKGSGKSRLFTDFLKFSLIKDMYSKYFLVLPAYNNEASDSYGFLRQFKDKVVVFDKYDEDVVAKRVLKECNKAGRVCFAIDDGTASLAQNLDETLRLMITTNRHLKLTFYISLHSCKKVLSPVLRQNIDHLFVFKLTNAKLLDDIHEEWVSMRPEEELADFRKFRQVFQDKINTHDHNAMAVVLNKSAISFDVEEWEIHTLHDRLK